MYECVIVRLKSDFSTSNAIGVRIFSNKSSTGTNPSSIMVIKLRRRDRRSGKRSAKGGRPPKRGLDGSRWRWAVSRSKRKRERPWRSRDTTEKERGSGRGGGGGGGGVGSVCFFLERLAVFYRIKDEEVLINEWFKGLTAARADEKRIQNVYRYV